MYGSAQFVVVVGGLTGDTDSCWSGGVVLELFLSLVPFSPVQQANSSIRVCFLPQLHHRITMLDQGFVVVCRSLRHLGGLRCRR